MLVKAILLYAFFLQVSLGKILQAFVIFRHGARTPITFYYEPNQYKEKPGILTELGKQQVRELGQQLRKRYIDDADLVSSDYNHHEVFLRSSVKLRTNESTYHLLQGLFPEKDIEDIHVNYVSLVRDLYYHAHREDQCPFIIPIIKSMKRTDEYRYMEEYFKNNLYSRIVDRVNEEGKHNYTIDMLSMKQAKKVFDGFKCNRAHGLKNPNYSEEEVALFYKLNLWYSYSYKFGSDIVRKLANSPVFAEIRKFMHCLNETNQHMHHECPRLILFSAHDSNLISILKSFVPLEKLLDDRRYLPPFAADITIEVHQDDFTEETWIEVYYNGKPLALWEEGKEKVSTDEFHNFLQDNILHDIAATCDG